MKKRRLQGPSLAWICLLLGALILGGSGSTLGSDYLAVRGPCHFSFPEDHGAHPGYETEWWYYTGNLHEQSGRPFGFQLTFFRRQIVPPGAEKGWPSDPSSWRAKNLFMAHAALSDIGGGRFYWDEGIAREAVGLAGAREGEGAIEIFLGGWKTTMAPSGHYLVAKTDRFSFDLMCRPQKTPVAHGVSGYSQKGVKPESASCYYSSTRLRTSGTLSVDGRTFTVQGTAWMDHEYSTAPLEPSLVGWDWFSLQFTDNTELMLYILRAKDGAWSPSSSGTFVHSSGAARHLSRDDFQVDILERWRSPHSGTRYPARWRIRVLPLNVDVELFPSLPDQELRLTHSMNVSYWEGSVKIKGSKAHRAAEGVGYVEMTGYAKPFDLLNQRIMRPVNDNKDK